ncbi:ABC transporter ATP-binding protein [Streptomyces sp. NPDC050529]|uniref:ABC transporter ATP-binding protein n=1 Tax=Streptomyces sp. NPDC050529 TaxID=3365624 RepID=UPI00379AD17F
MPNRNPEDAPHVWFRVVGLLARDSRGLILSITVLVISVVLGMLSTVLLKEIVDVALPQHRVGLLSTICTIMALANILTSIFTVVSARLNNKMGQKLVHTLRRDVYRATQAMPLEYFTSKSTSEVSTRISSDIGGVSDVLTFAAQGFIGSFIGLAASVAIMMVMSWQIALVSLLLAILMNLLNNRYSRRRRQLAHTQQACVADMMRSVGENLSFSGILLGRTMAREAWQLESFEKLSLRAAGEAVRQRLAGRTAFAIISMTLSLLPVIAYWAAGTVLSGVSLGAVIVISTLQARISIPIQQLMQLGSELHAARALFERIFATIDACPEQESGGPAIRLAEGVSIAGISVTGVSFRYGESERKVLKGASLAVPAGKRVFLTGESGSGKSTLALILAGLLKPESGSLRVQMSDGSFTDDVASATIIVPQESVLFNQSIRENLLFGDPDCTIEEMTRVLCTVGLSHVVEAGGYGVDALVGERGAQLSGGERQRLALARALLSDYPILILDEFTSGIDKETSDAIFERLLCEHGRRTMIFVTHSLPPLGEDDLVFVVKDGGVAQASLSSTRWRHGDPQMT